MELIKDIARRRMTGIAHILRREEGAVTVDWVVLTAAIVGMSLTVFVPLFTSTGGVANVIAENITTTVAAAGQ